MYEWTIIGGGIHGVTSASFLRSKNVSTRDILILDSNEELLAKWKQSTQAIGMTALRSTAVHHVASDPLSLKKFSNSREGRSLGKLRGKYGHPDLELFNGHAKREIERHNLQQSHCSDTVCDISMVDNHWLVSTDSNKEFKAKRILFAPGCSCNLPAWYLKSSVSDVRFSLAHEQIGKAPLPHEHIIVVGAGMSGVQAARFYAKTTDCKVSLIASSFPEKHYFDCKSGWNGPKYLSTFRSASCMRYRRFVIQSERKPGSVPPVLHSEFRKLCAKNKIQFIKGTVTDTFSSAGHIEVKVSKKETPTIHIYGSRVILATGFAPECPHNILINKIATEAKLPLAPCGFPIPRQLSHWGKRFYLSGSLAELAVGPFSRNISGARMVALELANNNT